MTELAKVHEPGHCSQMMAQEMVLLIQSSGFGTGSAKELASLSTDFGTGSARELCWLTAAVAGKVSHRGSSRAAENASVEVLGMKRAAWAEAKRLDADLAIAHDTSAVESRHDISAEETALGSLAVVRVPDNLREAQARHMCSSSHAEGMAVQVSVSETHSVFPAQADSKPCSFSSHVLLAQARAVCASDPLPPSQDSCHPDS